MLGNNKSRIYLKWSDSYKYGSFFSFFISLVTIQLDRYLLFCENSDAHFLVHTRIPRPGGFSLLDNKDIRTCEQYVSTFIRTCRYALTNCTASRTTRVISFINVSLRRLLVASQNRTIFYDATNLNGPLHPVALFTVATRLNCSIE